LTNSLSAQGLTVLTAQQLPPNDGAISLGQASIALLQMANPPVLAAEGGTLVQGDQ